MSLHHLHWGRVETYENFVTFYVSHVFLGIPGKFEFTEDKFEHLPEVNTFYVWKKIQIKTIKLDGVKKTMEKKTLMHT